MAKKTEPTSIKHLPRGGVTAAKGFRAGGVKAGIKASGAPDSALLVSDRPCSAAGCFTTNKVRAACVDWNESLLPSDGIRAIFCNSGNANACTGARGARDVRTIAALSGRLVGARDQSVLVASTGVIGHHLPMDKITAGIDALASRLTENGGDVFSRAIMTTDTRQKQAAVNVTTSKGTYAIGGCCKGAGMICPNMATMLAFVTTDVKITARQLAPIVRRTVDRTFNNLTIDGDTSTNDMVLVLANGASGAAAASTGDLRIFEEGLFAVCNSLCAQIAADGEGATKRVEIRVTGGKTFGDAQKVARSVANSNLLKCALFGNDPNWGRILCAIGYSGGSFSRENLRVKLCGTLVCRGTTPVAFNVPAVRTKMAKKVMAIDIDLGEGTSEAIAHTCDFSYDYVKINAEYHT